MNNTLYDSNNGLRSALVNDAASNERSVSLVSLLVRQRNESANRYLEENGTGRKVDEEKLLLNPFLSLLIFWN